MKRLGVREIELVEPGHQYRLLDGRDVEFDSCTKFIDGFFEPFLAAEIAARLVATNPNYQGRTVADVLAEWRDAARFGTAVHAEIDRTIKTKGGARDGLSTEAASAIAWIDRRFPAERFDHHPEHRVFSEDLRLAGTIDFLAVDRETKRATIVDWKTNRRITRSAFRGKRGIRGPARELEDCHVVKYGLQMSLYGHLLEREYGIEVAVVALVHLTDDGAAEIPCDYAGDVVLRLLEHDGRA